MTLPRPSGRDRRRLPDLAWVIATMLACLVTIGLSSPAAATIAGPIDPESAQSPDPPAEVLLQSESGPEVDEDFPPGDPVMREEPGDNPVLGSDGPGAAADDERNYRRLGLIGLGLIAAGYGLVRLEGWERRRSGNDD